MKYIILKDGQKAEVDDEDYDMLSKFKWHCLNGYAKSFSERHILAMHRLVTHAQKGLEVDHLNGNRLDNRRSNLRVCTKSVNLQSRKLPKNNTSGYRGVFFQPKSIFHPWHTHIAFNKKIIYVGSYTNKKDAALAYDLKAVELYGKLAKTNFKF